MFCKKIPISLRPYNDRKLLGRGLSSRSPTICSEKLNSDIKVLKFINNYMYALKKIRKNQKTFDGG